VGRMLDLFEVDVGNIRRWEKTGTCEPARQKLTVGCMSRLLAPRRDRWAQYRSWREWIALT
jgi:hypothetical protein